MTEEDNPYFELSDSEHMVRIEPKYYLYSDADNYWDKNWILTIVKIKAGKFSGRYEANFMTASFEKFRNELTLLYNNLGGAAIFTCLEHQLKLHIQGDGIGHFEVDVIASDAPGIGSTLTFEMTFDQTILKELNRQITGITNSFPVIGKL